ncbi:MAG: hypothetical protein ACRDEA_14045 [Microcystaceae cyanobacterium]
MKTESKPNTSKPEFGENHPLNKPSKFRHLPLIVILLLVLNLLATCRNSTTSQMAAKNQPYIYVQNVDGTTSQAQPSDPLLRSNSVIAKFTEDWLKLAYTWKAPPEKGEAFVNERGVDFPYQFHAASVAIVPGYREGYMDRVAQKYQREFPFANYITGQQQSYVRSFEEPKIELIRKGVWDVTIVATRIHASRNSIFANEIFNHVIRVQAIKPASDDDKKLWGDRETHLGRLFNEMQRQGLQIVEITEF